MVLLLHNLIWLPGLQMRTRHAVIEDIQCLLQRSMYRDFKLILILEIHKRKCHDSSANKSNTDNTISWLVWKIVKLMCCDEIKQRQCLLCWLIPAPVWFMEAAPSSRGCLVQPLACQQTHASLVLLYRILESET